MEVRLSVFVSVFVEQPLQSIDEDFLHMWPEWLVVEDTLRMFGGLNSDPYLSGERFCAPIARPRSSPYLHRWEDCWGLCRP